MNLFTQKIFTRLIFSSLIACFLFLVSCNSKIESSNLSINDFSNSLAENQNDAKQAKSSDCYKSQSSQSFVNCLNFNKIDSTNELKILNSKVVNKIETQFDEENNNSDERNIEVATYQKNVFSKASDYWQKFAKSECEFLNNFQSENFSDCYQSQISLRLSDLFEAYFVPFDDDLKRLERKKNLALLKPMSCDETVSGGTIEINDCESQKLQKAENDLKDLIQKMKKNLNSNQKIELEIAQNNWASFIENHCRAINSYENPFGTSNASMNLTCLNIATGKRIREIKLLSN